MSVQSLLTQLDEIFAVLRAKDNLAAPLTTEEIDNLSESLPFVIPNSLKSLYQWHDGILSFIPGYNLLSFSNALAEYQQLIEVAEDLQDTEFYFEETYFPILQLQDSWFVVDCDPNAGTRIYDVFLEGGEIHKAYENLEQFLNITVEAYLSRAYYKAYYVEDDFWEENRVLFQKIKNKYLSPEQLQEREAVWEALCSEVTSPSVLTSWDKQSLITRLRATYDERAIEYLRRFLSDRDPEIVAKAAFELGALKARETLPDLLKLLKHPIAMVRNLSAHAIGAIVTPDDQIVVRPMINLLADSETLVRIGAVTALGQLRSRDAVLPLIDLLQTQNRWVSHVIQALKKIGDARAIEPLRRLRGEIRSGQDIHAIDRAISYMQGINL